MLHNPTPAAPSCSPISSRPYHVHAYLLNAQRSHAIHDREEPTGRACCRLFTPSAVTTAPLLSPPQIPTSPEQEWAAQARGEHDPAPRHPEHLAGMQRPLPLNEVVPCSSSLGTLHMQNLTAVLVQHDATPTQHQTDSRHIPLADRIGARGILRQLAPFHPSLRIAAHDHLDDLAQGDGGTAVKGMDRNS